MAFSPPPAYSSSNSGATTSAAHASPRHHHQRRSLLESSSSGSDDDEAENVQLVSLDNGTDTEGDCELGLVSGGRSRRRGAGPTSAQTPTTASTATTNMTRAGRAARFRQQQQQSHLNDTTSTSSSVAPFTDSFGRGGPTPSTTPRGSVAFSSANSDTTACSDEYAASGSAGASSSSSNAERRHHRPAAQYAAWAANHHSTGVEQGNMMASSSSSTSSSSSAAMMQSASSNAPPPSSSGWSSRAASPNPPDYYGWETPGTASATPAAASMVANRHLSRRAASRTPSGAVTPNQTEDRSYYKHDEQDHYRTNQAHATALLRRLTASIAPEGFISPQQQQQAVMLPSPKKRKPGWWRSRAEARSRRESDPHELSTASSSASLASYSSTPTLVSGLAPSTTGKVFDSSHYYSLPSSRRGSHCSSLTGSPTPSAAAPRRSCMSLFCAALLRQPWVPTQPLTIVFALLLLGCFAATVTTSLMHVLSNDKQPLPWRSICQAQQPFPHDLADSLAPVNVFVGVFTVDAASERRHLIRSTYAKHTRPIDPVSGMPANNVQLKFILGRPRESHARRVALEMETYNDIVVLDLPENMNRGKTHAFFKWAQENATVPVVFAPPDANNDEDGADHKRLMAGFKRADYVVKADDDSFLVLDELERHLRITPRTNTYWGYLVRNLFMAGEAYALSADLVDYIATYEPLQQFTKGAEDKRVAKWMRMHPRASAINWISERCWVYDHPKAGTTYAHGFLFPDEVERVRAEGRRGLSSEERARRGGDLADAWSTVTQWKEEYKAPAPRMTIEEQVEALVEGGGRWARTGWTEDAALGRLARQGVRYDDVVFDSDAATASDEKRTELVDKRLEGLKRGEIEPEYYHPGIPDAKQPAAPKARTVKIGKDLFRNPFNVDAVRLDKRSVESEAESKEPPTTEEATSTSPEEEETPLTYHNQVRPPPPDALIRMSDRVLGSMSSSEATTGKENEASYDSDEAVSSLLSSSPSRVENSTSSEEQPSVTEDEGYVNEPTGQIRFGGHKYILPPVEHDDEDSIRLMSKPTLRYDPTTLGTRAQRMLGRRYGGTVAVHFLKRNEWFLETSLALIGREKTWDFGTDAYAYSPYAQAAEGQASRDLDKPLEADPRLSDVPQFWDGTASQMQLVENVWGGARMHGSPVILANGHIDSGRPVESELDLRRARRQGQQQTSALNGRVSRSRPLNQ